MKCCCECRCGQIPPHEALNDRLYWIEINSGRLQGTRCAAWRAERDLAYPWVADLTPVYARSGLSHEQLSDSVVTVIHEIIPED